MFLELKEDQRGWSLMDGKRKRSECKVQIHYSRRLARMWERVNWENALGGLGSI